MTPEETSYFLVIFDVMLTVIGAMLESAKCFKTHWTARCSADAHDLK